MSRQKIDTTLARRMLDEGKGHGEIRVAVSIRAGRPLFPYIHWESIKDALKRDGKWPTSPPQQ